MVQHELHQDERRHESFRKEVIYEGHFRSQLKTIWRPALAIASASNAGYDTLSCNVGLRNVSTRTIASCFRPLSPLPCSPSPLPSPLFPLTGTRHQTSKEGPEVHHVVRAPPHRRLRHPCRVPQRVPDLGPVWHSKDLLDLLLPLLWPMTLTR